MLTYQYSRENFQEIFKDKNIENIQGGGEVLEKDVRSPDMGCKKSCPCMQ
jgi:hypothetical protein